MEGKETEHRSRGSVQRPSSPGVVLEDLGQIQRRRRSPVSTQQPTSRFMVILICGLLLAGFLAAVATIILHAH